MYLVSMPRKDISYSGNNNSDPSAPRITCQGVCGCPLGHVSTRILFEKSR